MLTLEPVPDVVSYNVTLSACKLGTQLAHALELLRWMPRRSLAPDVVSYSTVISSCGRESK